MYLFFDTETTGKANFKLPSLHPSQPRIVQLAAMLTDDEGAVKGEYNALIKPNGWSIPLEASAIHGITTEECEKYGVEIKSVLAVFNMWLKLSPTPVAHNSDFDTFVINGETDRLEKNSLFANSECYCTMKASTNIVKLPSTFGKGYKWPTLQELHKFLFGVNFEDAHDAMSDVKACAKCMFELKKRQNETKSIA